VNSRVTGQGNALRNDTGGSQLVLPIQFALCVSQCIFGRCDDLVTVSGMQEAPNTSCGVVPASVTAGNAEGNHSAVTGKSTGVSDACIEHDRRHLTRQKSESLATEFVILQLSREGRYWSIGDEFWAT
jgi:hypothetical protein